VSGWGVLPPGAPPPPTDPRERWRRAWLIARTASRRWREGEAWLGAYLGEIEYAAWRALHARHGVEA
jgi:hypothetical protein